MGTVGRKKIRDSSKQVKIRIDESMDTDLRILYGLDKISSGGMSFNQWLVFQFHKLILGSSDKLKIVKMKYEAKLFVDGEERKIV
jgi:hypothetical protein